MSLVEFYSYGVGGKLYRAISNQEINSEVISQMFSKIYNEVVEDIVHDHENHYIIYSRYEPVGVNIFKVDLIM